MEETMNKIEWPEFAARVAEFTGTDAKNITIQTSVFNDLGIDSLGLFSLGLFLIKSFGTRIPINAVASIQTVGDIFNLMNKYRNG